MRKVKYYTIGTLRGCDIADHESGHVKSTRVTYVGYTNDTLEVTCSCGGQWKALTYAKPKNRRK
jgi:hypothetical protein